MSSLPSPRYLPAQQQSQNLPVAAQSTQAHTRTPHTLLCCVADEVACSRRTFSICTGQQHCSTPAACLSG